MGTGGVKWLGAAMWIGLAVAVGAPAPLHATPEDKVVAAGRLKLAGRIMRCGRTPTLISDSFWDYGGASRGYIILNSKKLVTLPRAVRLYVYAHECGHQIYGVSEPKADCYAVRRGRKAGWLDRKGLDQICEFLKDTPGDYVHPPGPERCKAMTACFAKSRPARSRAGTTLD